MNSKLFYSAIVGFSVGFYGCSGPSGSEPAADTSAPAADTAHGEHSEHAHEGHGEVAQDEHAGQSDMDKMMAQLAKLSPEDRASAEKQHFCPVSGDMLGLMGPPLKVEVNGQTVWICCPDCKDPLLADPDKYLAKLDGASPHE